MLPYFLEKLKSIQEGDGNLLDKTLIIYGSPMGDRNLHNHRRCPLILLGGANGKLAGNLHLKAPDGTPMANVMLSVMHIARPRRPEALRRQHRRPSRSSHMRDAMRLARSAGRVRAGGAARSARGATATDDRRWPTPRCAATRAQVRALLKQGADVNARAGRRHDRAALGGARAATPTRRACSSSPARGSRPRRASATTRRCTWRRERESRRS